LRPNKARRIAEAAQANDEALAKHITSLAIAVEAIETLLVAENILADGDVMAQIKALIESKQRSIGAPQQI
jgi:hypothetical protein